MGHPLVATYLYYAPSEGLGFGPRRLEGMPVVHTLERGLTFLRKDLLLLDRWLLGFPGSLAAAAGLQRIHARTPRALLRAAPALLALLLAGNSVLFLTQHTGKRIKTQKHKRAVTERLRSAPPGSMVLVDDLRRPHIGEMLLNPRGLDSDPLLLRHLKDDVAVAQRIFPERQAFLYDAERPGALIPLPPPTGRIQLERPASRMGHHTGRLVAGIGTGMSCLEASVQEGDEPGWFGIGKQIYLPRGRYRITFEGNAQGLADDAPCVAELASDYGRTLLAQQAFSGSITGVLATLDVEILEPALRVEPRLRYGGSGTIRYQRVVFDELP